jgi:PEP-CTERM motif
MRQRILFLALGLLTAATFAHAGTITGTTTRSGNDSANWGQLGGCGTTIPASFSATSTDGIGITGTLAGDGQVRFQTTCLWGGNFASGDNVLWTDGNGPLTLAFSKGVSGAGAQIEADLFGAFTATICVNGTVFCFSESGDSTSGGDNSAIYIGFLDTTPVITSITFSIVGGNTDFAINQLSLTDGVSTTPEPSSLLLFGTSLLGLAPFRRKLFGR